MSLPQPEAPTRVIDATRLREAVRAYEESVREHEADPSMERAMLVAVAETVLRGLW